MRTTLRLDYEPSGTRHIVRALLRIEGEPGTEQGRTPLDLAIVLDRSGSMHGAKLAAACEAAALLARRLRPDDRLAVVTYDDRVDTLASPATGAAQPDLAARILAIHPGGSTNLSGGWLRGRELLAALPAEGRARRILLLTDGLANVGVTDPGRLTGLCASARDHGIRTTTIGFGEDYDERLLRGMADAGGGNAYYIERPDQAPSIFMHEFEGLAALAAQNLAVRVRPSGATLAAVHHTYPRTEEPGGLRLDLGDLYAREPRSLLVELHVPGGAVDPRAIAELTVTADVLRDDGAISREQVRLPITFSPADGPRVDPEVRRELLLLAAARAREEALEDRARGDWDGAAQRLAGMADSMAEAGLDDAELREEAEELRTMQRSMASAQLSAMDAKHMYQQAYDRGRAMPASKADLIRRKHHHRDGQDA